MHILLADDDGDLRNYIQKGLEKSGYIVTATSDGIEAQDAIKQVRFDLLITDIVMPGMTGIELAQFAVKHQSDIKVIFITGFCGVFLTSPDDLPNNIATLSKPFHLKDLIAQIHEELRKMQPV